jgi:aryl-alcohol dehydrogenase-like predicted oxidoreductase
MEHVRLGRTGLKISRLILGCMSYGSSRWRPWVLDEEASRPFFQRALELGFTTFDTADMYSLGASEEVTGRALRDFTRREDVVIATKVFWPMGEGPNARGLSRKHILASIDASLKRLGTDHVDLYQIHRFDPHTPVEETAEALNDVVRAGKALYVGASSMWAWQFAKMLHVQKENGWARFVSMQPQLNLLYREEEREMLPLCLDQGVGVIPWSPLARGFLAGDRRREGGGGGSTRSTSDSFSDKLYGSPEDHDVAEAVSAVARARGARPMQVALAWVLQHGAVSAPIVGATKLSHLDDAAAALSLTLEPEEIARLEGPYRPKPVIDHD